MLHLGVPVFATSVYEWTPRCYAFQIHASVIKNSNFRICLPAWLFQKRWILHIPKYKYNICKLPEANLTVNVCIYMYICHVFLLSTTKINRRNELDFSQPVEFRSVMTCLILSFLLFVYQHWNIFSCSANILLMLFRSVYIIGNFGE